MDSAYVGPRCEAVFERNEVESKVIERPYRNRPLTAGQQRRNRAIKEFIDIWTCYSAA